MGVDDRQPVSGSAPRRPRMIRIGVTVTITACIMAIVVVGLGSVAWEQWSTAKRNTEELTRRNAVLIADQIDQYLDQFLEPAAQYVEYMAGRSRRTGWNREEARIPDDLLMASIAAAPEIERAGVLFASGRDIWAERSADTLTVNVEDRTADPAYEGVLEVLPATDVSWSSPRFDRRLGHSVIRVWAVAGDAADTRSAWYADVSLGAVSEAITDVGERFRGTAFVMYGDDGVLAHPSLAFVHPELGDDRPVVTVDRVGDLALETLWRSSANVPAGQDGLGTLVGKVGDQAYVGYFRRTERYDGVPWTVGVWFAADQVQVYEQRLATAAWTAGAIIVLTLVVSVFAGRAIAYPIRRTSDAVSAVAKADFSVAADLPPSRIAELNDLARAFNSMRTALSLFERYVPRSLVRKLMDRDVAFNASEEREVTVMFTDIVGFTSIAEGRSAAEVAEFVNHHFGILGQCVEKYGGTIDKYIGDALMAFWGAPDDMRDAPSTACYCAMAMVDELEKDNAKRRKEGLPPVRIRIGVHTGKALVGNIGAEGRINYTIIGDTVNTCQRLESLGREVASSGSSTILVSDAVAKHLPASMPYMQVGSFAVKGRTEEINAYRLVT